jgi:multicomponent Na+:H+ antiporter subunit B
MMDIMDIIVIPILALLAATAVTVARIRNLWAAVMFTGIYSFLSASWMLILDAPDVAFTEAAVGAGITTILMLATLSLTPLKRRTDGRLASEDFEEKPSKSPVLPLMVVTITGFALIYGTIDMPHFGDANAPIQVYPDPSFVEKSQPDMHGLPNVVTAVLASYRGYDTLGETAVIFTAGIAVLLILRKNTEKDELPVLVDEDAKEVVS